MGRIKTQLIKRVTAKLLKEYPNDWKKTFEENKPAVNSHLDGANKKLRNIIAGYLTRQMNRSET